jgi:hypothetical protein
VKADASGLSFDCRRQAFRGFEPQMIADEALKAIMIHSPEISGDSRAKAGKCSQALNTKKITPINSYKIILFLIFVNAMSTTNPFLF